MSHSHRALALPVLAVLFALSAMAGCNTIRGAGQDVQAGGAAVEGAATSVQSDMQRSDAEREAKEARDRDAAARAAH